MNKRVKTFTTRYARDTETPSYLRQGYGDQKIKYKCGVYFVHAGTRDQNKRHGFLEEYVEGEELIIPPLSLHGRRSTEGGCLRASSVAGGESLHIVQVVI